MESADNFHEINWLSSSLYVSRRGKRLKSRRMRSQSVSQNERSHGNRCDTKRRFQTRQMGELALKKYFAQILFSTMQVYNCRIHDCFHLGHSKHMRNESIMVREKAFNLFEV